MGNVRAALVEKRGNVGSIFFGNEPNLRAVSDANLDRVPTEFVLRISGEKTGSPLRRVL